jgi:hypothetical protein
MVENSSEVSGISIEGKNKWKTLVDNIGKKALKKAD